VQRVALPGVRSAELVLQSTRERLRETLGLRQSQIVVATDADHESSREDTIVSPAAATSRQGNVIAPSSCRKEQPFIVLDRHARR